MTSRGPGCEGSCVCMCEDVGSIRMCLNASVENPPQGHLNSRVSYFFLQEVQWLAAPRLARWPTDFTTDPSSTLSFATLGLLCHQLLVTRGWRQLRHLCVLTYKAPGQTRTGPQECGPQAGIWFLTLSELRGVAASNLHFAKKAAEAMWSGNRLQVLKLLQLFR